MIRNENLYVGIENYKKINSEFPIFINDGLVLYNLNDSGFLIDNKFSYFKTHPHSVLTNGELYNVSDYVSEGYCFALLSYKL